MLNRPRILIVDDDESISDLLSLYLIKEQYDTKIAADGETALACFDEFNPSLIILDLMLPGIDGYGVCREIRTKSKVPIIVLSAKGDTFDKVLALELGADDYVEKPFDTKEIVARVKAALRRASYTTPVEETSDVDKVSYPGLSINLTEYSVVYNNEPIDMPPKEIELLYFLAKTPNHVFTREQLLDKIWGYEYLGDTRTVDVHIKRIREKINDHEMWKITTIWGIGYKFELKEEAKG
ncbi:MAG: response regulator transcription factor [Lachnospiraceae bacterium]|nr:response regulator transcription factor [Lachnospiraceae bacterium]